MTDIEKIRAEVERLMDEYKPTVGGVDELTGAHIILAKLLSFLDTLQEQGRPEPYNPTYDEAYLNEKITKASKTWKGVDVDKYMDEVRGRESEKPTSAEGLEEEITRTYHDGSVADTTEMDHVDYENIARHFAQWGADHTPLPEDTVLFNKGVEEGKRLMREEMPKWYKVKRGSCFDKHTNFLLSAREGHFYCSAMEVPRDGYILLVDELERLPKED